MAWCGTSWSICMFGPISSMSNILKPPLLASRDKSGLAIRLSSREQMRQRHNTKDCWFLYEKKLLVAKGIATRSDRTLLRAPGRTSRNKKLLETSALLRALLPLIYCWFLYVCFPHHGKNSRDPGRCLIAHVLEPCNFAVHHINLEG